jgi:hypothetical protein
MLLVTCMLFPPMPAHAQKSYRDATGGFLNMTRVLDCSAACTTSNSSVTPIDIGAFTSGVLIINVTAVSGTSPSLTVNFQTCDGTGGSAPANTNCVNHTTGSAITATGLQIIKVDHFSRWVTVTSTISGTTPSFTYTVTGYFKPTS